VGPGELAGAAVIGMNVVTFGLFAWDKLAARRGRRRVPEAWLLVPSALGGSVGAWLGSLALRHKTRKPAFLAKLVLATALNALWLWLALRGTGP
jgi:uncharacterized membrane protein YsdA (DUF1294 family)